MADDFRLIFRRTGGPEVIEREAIEMPPLPGPGEAMVRHTAVGLNFIDIYYRKGLYPASLPSGLGTEAAGVIEAVGEGVSDLAPGQRVAYAGGPLGAYTTVRALPAEQLVPLPDAIDDRTAAAAMLKGLTADYLVGRCSRIQAGQTALVHAATGGVGSILVQWLKHLGVTVIAHAGTAAKAEQAKALGADHALSCPFDDLAATVRELTDGRGVDVVYDGVGAASWQASLGSAATLGLLISYGNASGPVPPVSPLELTKAGSIFLTRPTLAHYVATRADRLAAADRLFQVIASGAVKIGIGQDFPLAEAAQAQEALAARRTTGSTILLP
ncbi:quinone oxidoreductase [Sphingomonas oleivorans]|uniref:Quinone oxidoreductase n=1 Tax=Sphingomonas oleivorans TaxID=1735121 RepID=A0A2T5G2P7_9SPHN|nr:quinone oxidoreductase [Sphingomonas oleivorans]PTQ13419.1 quinone oxidoreductase [Sphingomonas oleivorans]